MTNDFVYTTAIKKLRRLKKRTKVVPGGTSGGKTFGILPILIDRAARFDNLEISVVSESVPHLKKGSLKDFKKIMRATNRWIDDHWHSTDMKYTFGKTHSFIEFFSADDDGKVHGPRRNILYLNEANNIKFETFHALQIRTDKEVWLDFNPTAEFWADTELKEDEDIDWLTLTYRDNEALSPAIVKEIEKAKYKAYFNPHLEGSDVFIEQNVKSKYWDNWWRVYGLGMTGRLEGVVFDNWEIVQNLPEAANLVGTGLDFGYTNDPTAAIDVYKWNDYRVLDERCYRTGMVNADIAKILNKKIIVYADSAEPKSIEEIKRMGIMIKGVTKGSDSINFGIQVMQDQKYLVTARSVNLIKELRNYCWDTDKTGKKLNKPVDNWNHGIDAVRYHEMESIGLIKHASVSKPKKPAGLNFGR